MVPSRRVYAASVGTGVVARYVSEAPITSTGTFEITAACSAEANAQTFSTTFDNQRYTYTFASIETNISVEELRTTTVAALGSIPLAEDGREILVRAGGYPGLAEVFLVNGDQLERYVALNAVGLPVTFNDLIFAETRFRYEAQVSVDDHRNGVPGELAAPVRSRSMRRSSRRKRHSADDRVYRHRYPRLSVHRYADRDRPDRPGSATAGRRRATARLRPDHAPDHGHHRADADSTAERADRSARAERGRLADTTERSAGGVA